MYDMDKDVSLYNAGVNPGFAERGGAYILRTLKVLLWMGGGGR